MFSFVTVVHEIFIIVCSQKSFLKFILLCCSFFLLHFFGSTLKKQKNMKQFQTLMEKIVLLHVTTLILYYFECTNSVSFMRRHKSSHDISVDNIKQEQRIHVWLLQIKFIIFYGLCRRIFFIILTTLTILLNNIIKKKRHIGNINNCGIHYCFTLKLVDWLLTTAIIN